MLKLPDLSTPYGRALFEKKVQEGWEPTIGTYWVVISYDPKTRARSYLPVVRTDSMQSALELAIAQSRQDAVIGIIFVCAQQVITEEDVLTWRTFRDQHKGSPTS